MVETQKQLTDEMLEMDIPEMERPSHPAEEIGVPYIRHKTGRCQYDCNCDCVYDRGCRI